MYYNNKKLALSIFWVVLGAALIALSRFGVIDATLYSGLGGGLVAVGLVQIHRNMKYRKNKEYREKVDIEVTDERSNFIRMKSWAIAGYIMVLMESVGSLVAMLMGQVLIQRVLLISLSFFVCCYMVAMLVLRKKY